MILDSLCDLKCKTSHSRNLEIGTLGKAPPCCSRTRHKFEATKCQSHHTWQMCLPNSPSETSSHLVMMSHVSWVSHSKSPMMYPRCPESRYKKEEYPVTYHCHLHVPGFSWKSCSHHFFTKLHSNINISFKLPRFQKKIGCLGLYWWETARHCGAEQTSPRFFLQKFPQRNAENLSLAPHLSLAFESRPRTEPPWSSKAQCLNGKTWPKQRFKGSVGTKRAPWFSGRPVKFRILPMLSAPTIPTSQASTVVFFSTAFAAGGASTFDAATKAERPAMHCLDSLNRYGIANCKSPGNSRCRVGKVTNKKSMEKTRETENCHLQVPRLRQKNWAYDWNIPLKQSDSLWLKGS